MQFPLKKLNIEFPHEKICPKLYKAHAPSEAIEVMKKIEPEGNVSPEVINNGRKGEKWKTTTIAYKSPSDRIKALAQVFVGERGKIVKFTKLCYASIAFRIEGERVSFARGNKVSAPKSVRLA